MQDPSTPARRHRRRVRPTAGEHIASEPAIDGQAATNAGAAAAGPADSAPPAQATRRPRPDRGLRDLVGGGPSQLGVSGALRGRDVDRPTEQELAEAERDLVIVRRNWTPESP